MKIVSALLSVLVLFSCCCSVEAKSAVKSPAVAKPVAPIPQKPRLQTVTPQDKLKADVQAFVALLNGKNILVNAEKYVWGARIGFFGATEWQSWWKRERLADELVVADVKIHKMDSAEAEVSFAYRTYPKEVATYNAGLFRMRFDYSPLDAEKQQPKLWQFVPRPPAQNESLTSHPMLWAIWMLAQSPESLGAFRTQVALANLHALGVAARKFEQDFNDVYAFSAEFQEEALQYYVRRKEAWVIPGTNEKFLFNNRLSGKNPAHVAEPSRTILFYDGSDEKPKFRFNGKALVCLVDGHVELADAARFQSFVWQ